MVMTLQEVIKAVDRLTPDEVRQLLLYLEQREIEIMTEQPPSPEDRARRLNEAFAQLRKGLTPRQIDEIVEAMNEEYIEPWDESQWTD